MEQNKTTPRRNRFNNKYKDFSDSEILREILFAQELQLQRQNELKPISTWVQIWSWLSLIGLLIYVASQFL